MSPLRRGPDGLLLPVRVTPRSSRNEVVGLHTAVDGSQAIAVKVTAPPDKGKANAAVIETVARAAGIPKSALAIVSGETSRNKVLRVTGNFPALEAWIAALKDKD